MKKIYIQPTVKEIKINLPVVLAAGSPTQDPESQTYLDPEEETYDND